MLLVCTVTAAVPALIQHKFKWVYFSLATMSAFVAFCIWGGGYLYCVVFSVSVPFFIAITWMYHKSGDFLREEEFLAKWTSILFNSLIASTVFVYLQLSWNTLPAKIYLRIKYADYWYSTYSQSESALQLGTSILLASAICLYIRYRMMLDQSRDTSYNAVLVDNEGDSYID